MTALSESQLIGSALPRLVTPWATDATDAGQALRTARLSGLLPAPMPWQAYAMARALERRPQGYCWTRVGAVVGRGSGKSQGLLAPRILHAMVDRGSSVLGLAQNLETAKGTWDQVLATLDGDRHLRRRIVKVTRGKGDARIELRHPDGRLAIYRLSVTAKGCRGPRADLLAVDEAAYVSNAVLSAATYVQMGTANADWQQVLAVSSAGDDQLDQDGTLPWFTKWRNAFLAGSDPELCWLEWSLPDGAELMDETQWPWAVPALGWRITPAEIRSKAGDAAWAQEVMTRWGVSATPPVIPPDAWARAQLAGADVDAVVAERPTPHALSVAVARDGERAAIGTAYRRDAGQLLVKVMDSRPGTDWAISELATYSKRWRLPVTLDRMGPAAPLADALVAAGVAVDVVTSDDYVTGCASFLADVMAQPAPRIRHLGQPILDAAASSAGRRDTGERWVWARRAGDVTAVEAVSVAAGAARSYLGKPVITHG